MAWIFWGVQPMKHLLTTIAELIETHNLPALMIGGHAVTALGHPRATFDLDLLIPRSSAQRWEEKLTSIAYLPFARSSNFLQFEASAGFPLPPIDLMLVDIDVFETLDSTKNARSVIATPSPTAMVALKLHAISQPSRRDTAQDWSDVISLIRVNGLTLDDAEFAAMICRHGGKGAAEKIRGELSGGN